MQLNLLVLRCKNIELTKVFYEKLGLTFVKEKHGNGVEHYSTYVNEMVLELYPLKENFEVEENRLGFTIECSYLENMKNDIISKYKFNNQNIVVIQDPDGRKIELLGEKNVRT